MIRVLIADDHELLRAGLKMIISKTEDIVVSGEASDGDEVIEKLKKDNFDIILLDIAMPKKTGLEVLKELKTSEKKIPVLILSTYSEEEYGNLAIKEGASGYLTKENVPEKLIDTIRNVSQTK